MRKLSIKVLLPILCVVALTVGTVGALWVQGAFDTTTPEDQPVATSTALSVADILARDGYLEGIWWPWFTHDDLGHGSGFQHYGLRGLHLRRGRCF